MGRRGIRMGQYNFKLAAVILILYIVLDFIDNTIKFFKNDPLRQTLKYIYNNSGIFILAVSFALVLVLLRLYRNSKLEEWEKLDRIKLLKESPTLDKLLEKYKYNPTDFEKYVAEVFCVLGYKAEVTQATNDGGKDIILYKDEKKYVVEVKLYSETNTIGRELIQKLQGAMLDCKADKAIFVTTSDFKRTAIEYASRNNVSLINGSKLVKMINKAIAIDFKNEGRVDIESTLLD